MVFKKHHVSKNLCGIAEQTIEFNNLTVRAKDNCITFEGNNFTGEIYASNPKWETLSFTLPAGTYYINRTPRPSSFNGMMSFVYNEDGERIASPESGGNAFTLAEETTCYLAFYVYLQQSVGIYTYNVMLNAGSTPQPYEPYSSEAWRDTLNYIHSTSADTLTTLPADIYPNDTTATVGLKGNMLQNGTPTPTNPIQPSECGEIATNILSVYKENYSINANGEETYNTVAEIYKAEVAVTGSEFTLSFKGISQAHTVRIHAYTGNTWKQQIAAININQVPFSFTVTSEVDNIRVSIVQEATDVAMTDGQYKIPIASVGENLFNQLDFSLLEILPTVFRYGTSLGKLPQGIYTFNAIKSAGAQTVYLDAKINNTYLLSTISISTVPFTFIADGECEYIIRTASNTGTTWEAEHYSDMMLNRGPTAIPYEPYKRIITNAYLGEVQTTRKIGKIDLSEVSWSEIMSGLWKTTNIPNIKYVSVNTELGDGIAEKYTIHTGSGMSTALNCIAIDVSQVSVNTGTSEKPTGMFWYALATEETGILNEPIRKIGAHADEVSGISIPVTAGANTLSVDTTLQPSEVTVNYKGWHPVVDVHERTNGAWD